MKLALTKARDLLSPDGHILVADCFRSEGFVKDRKVRVVGGGHKVARFHASLPELVLALQRSEDITDAGAPSIDLERGLFRVFGHAMTRVDEELRTRRPKSHWMLARALKLALGRRKINRLTARLEGRDRTSDMFRRNNQYLIALLARE